MEISGTGARSWFAWRPSRDTLVAAGSGCVILALSALMRRFSEVSPVTSILLRDVAMLGLVGILYPLWYMQRRGMGRATFGLHAQRWRRYLALNLLLAGLLLAVLRLSQTPSGFSLSGQNWGYVLYVMVAGIFEVVYFYGFQRTLFEQALGIVPAILLTAVFYSFHHMGFQTEFLKLFLVGIMYGSIYRMANSALLIYPFFWGVGALYDVLVQSQDILPIAHAWQRSIFLIGFMSIAMYLGQRWGLILEEATQNTLDRSSEDFYNVRHK